MENLKKVGGKFAESWKKPFANGVYLTVIRKSDIYEKISVKYMILISIKKICSLFKLNSKKATNRKREQLAKHYFQKGVKCLPGHPASENQTTMPAGLLQSRDHPSEKNEFANYPSIASSRNKRRGEVGRSEPQVFQLRLLLSQDASLEP